ncbi:MAG: tripartite tricarboxylate transporter substrate binding protein [Betaproteobacteria bacterium]|nr:tripartite tricarboxylate transporter substrate binding protein [Betaproteobacteria bacterium]
MTPVLRVFAACCAVIAWGASHGASTQSAGAQYPSRPIRFVVGFPPGGGNDTMARMIGQKLADRVGQSVVIDNRPGAGGNIAADLVAKATPDGYTILMIASSHPIQGLLKKNLPYDPIRDFSGVAQLVKYRSVLVIHPSVAAGSVRELLTLAKSRPGQLNFVSAGPGTGSHLAGELFKLMANVNIVHVPYKGTAQAMTDLMGGRVQLMFPPMVPVLPHLQSGRLRALAVTSKNRSRIMPELPSVAEAGIPDYEFSAWYGIVAPPRLARGIVGKLHAEIARVVQTAEVKERLSAQDMDVADATPEQFDEARKAEVAKWAKIVKQIGLQLD